MQFLDLLLKYLNVISIEKLLKIFTDFLNQINLPIGMGIAYCGHRYTLIQLPDESLTESLGQKHPGRIATASGNNSPQEASGIVSVLNSSPSGHLVSSAALGGYNNGLIGVPYASHSCAATSLNRPNIEI